MALLEVKELEKSYKKIKAVKGISFEVQKGELLGLLGPNGAGKSTTISMVSTLLKPDAGTILYNGEDITKTPKAIQKKLGYVPQEIALYPMLSGRENMMFWGRTYGLKGQKLKDRVADISEVIGIKDRLKDKVKTYSGGMKRRLNIGVALLHDPEIIIMDEPTVGIDPQSRNHILDTVLKLNRQGLTVIYTSHYMEEVEYLCNRICIMDQGEILVQGTKEDLIAAMDEDQEIHLKLEGHPEGIEEGLLAIDTVTDVVAEDGLFKVKCIEDRQIFGKLIETVGQTDGVILSMDVNEPNLEKLFLNLTGRDLRD